MPQKREAMKVRRLRLLIVTIAVLATGLWGYREYSRRGVASPERPVLEIIRKGSIIHVQLGFMHDVLWGSGVNIEVEQTPSGYKVLHWSDWIS